MKKHLLVLLSAVFILGITFTADAKKLMILKIDKGELPDDCGEGCVSSISEENSVEQGGFSLRLDFTKPSFAGQFRPKRGTWAGFRSLCFNIFSMHEKEVKLTFIIKDDNSDPVDSWCVIPFTIKPGMNECKLPVDTLKTLDGKPFSLDKIAQWDFGWKFFPDKDWEEKDKNNALTVYLSKLRLEEQ